jgi:ribosomal protein S1
MTTENVAALLSHNAVLQGVVAKPFIRGEQLVGAVLSFEGRADTALLHIKQMTGENPSDRLAALEVGDPLLVRIIIQEEGGRRSVWATEKGIEHQQIVDLFAAEPEKFKNIEATVQGLADFGVFVDLQSGPAKGCRALLRYSSLSSSGRARLGSFVAYKVGDNLRCDLAEARLDDNKLLLRLASARPAEAERSN